MLLENEKAKKIKNEKAIDQSETTFNFSRNKHKHTSYALYCRKRP